MSAVTPSQPRSSNAAYLACARGNPVAAALRNALAAALLLPSPARMLRATRTMSCPPRRPHTREWRHLLANVGERNGIAPLCSPLNELQTQDGVPSHAAAAQQAVSKPAAVGHGGSTSLARSPRTRDRLALAAHRLALRCPRRTSSLNMEAASAGSSRTPPQPPL
jgi:hypothetical protein